MVNLVRRTFFKSVGVVGGAIFANGMPLWSRADTPPARSAPDVFTGLSATLVGISETNLNPVIWPDQLSLADTYFDLLQLAAPQALKALVAEYMDLIVDNPKPQAIADQLLSSGGMFRRDPTGCAARLLTMMWLYGIWYGGTETTRNSSAVGAISNAAYQADFVISGRAYKNAWAWRIAQAHPMGFSQFNFGSWADLPPSLTDFGVVSV